MKIFLIGMMGSGKSSVGEKLSEYIDIPFFDTDNILVDNEGISIKEIFKKKGEKYFRQIEEVETIKFLKNKRFSYSNEIWPNRWRTYISKPQ